MKIKDFFNNGFKQGFKEKLKFVVMNKYTYEEKFSFNLSLIKVFIFTINTIFLLIAITISIITMTSLREYIPGYGSAKQGQKILVLQSKLDSLQQTINAYDVYRENIKNLFITEDFSKDTLVFQTVELTKNKKDKFAFTKEDSLLMKLKIQNKKTITNQSILIPKHEKHTHTLLYTPFSGKSIAAFNPLDGEYGMRFLCNNNVGLFAIASGNIVLCNKTVKAENIIMVQHPNDMLSVYKFKGEVLEEQKNIVKQGQMIGKTNNLSNEIYFELWINGKPVNPENYISF